MCLWIIIGHAILEIVIIIFLLLGFSFVLQNIIVVRTIGIAGGLLLIYFGLSIIKKVRRGNIQTGFLNSYYRPNHEHAPFENKCLDNPVVGGIMVSMGTDWILPI